MKLNVNELVDNKIEEIGRVYFTRQPINKMVDFYNKINAYSIAEEYPFEEIPKIFEKSENGRPHFRFLFNMKDYAEKNGLKKII